MPVTAAKASERGERLLELDAALAVPGDRPVGAVAVEGNEKPSSQCAPEGPPARDRKDERCRVVWRPVTLPALDEGGKRVLRRLLGVRTIACYRKAIGQNARRKFAQA